MEQVDFKSFWWLSPIHTAPPCSEFSDLKAFAQYRLGMTVRTIEGHPEINAARSMLANMAMNGGARVLLFVDCDTTTDHKTIVTLVKRAAEEGGIHSALYLRKTSKMIEGSKPYEPRRFCVTCDEPTIIHVGEGGGPVKFSSTGFGCIAINRDVFKKLYPYVPQVRWRTDPALDGRHYFMPAMQGVTYEHDDRVFLRRASRLGIPVHVHTDCLATHWKTIGIKPDERHEVVVGLGGEESFGWV